MRQKINVKPLKKEAFTKIIIYQKKVCNFYEHYFHVTLIFLLHLFAITRSLIHENIGFWKTCHWHTKCVFLLSAEMSLWRETERILSLPVYTLRNTWKIYPHLSLLLLASILKFTGINKLRSSRQWIKGTKKRQATTVSFSSSINTNMSFMCSSVGCRHRLPAGLFEEGDVQWSSSSLQVCLITILITSLTFHIHAGQKKAGVPWHGRIIRGRRGGKM